MAVAPGISIVEDMEKALQDALAIMTNQDLHYSRASDEIRTSVDLTAQKFIDVTKQMDCFFLQKRILLTVQKPEHLLVENIQELNTEVKRKDELIEKYNSKIQSWQTLVQDVPGIPRGPPPPHLPMPLQHPPQMQGSPSPMQQQQQPPVPPPQHPQQHHMIQHPQHSMASSPAPMQQQGMVMQGGGQMHGGPGGLQGPLAYLERTMSNIDYPSVNKKDSYKFL